MTTPTDAGTISVRQGQVLIVPATLYRADDSAVNLTPVGTTVAFQMFPKGGGAPLASGPATVLNAAGGVVQYTGSTADTASPGQHLGYFVVTIPGQSPVAYPADGITILVYPAIGALAGPQDGPCFPWTTADEVRTLVSGIDPAMDLTQWVEAGSQIMWALTGRQWDGLCSATIRPSHQVCTCGGGCTAHSWGWPATGGFWGYGGAFPVGLPFPGFGYGWGGSGQILGCSREILLGSDAREVTSIKIDGVEIDPATWRLDPGGRLIRVQPDPDKPPLWWPCCESPSAPRGGPGTFEVSYLFGADPPQYVVLASAVLAGEMALGANPVTAGACKLPRHIQTLTRQGVTGTFITDVSAILERGFTGIPVVDQAIAAANPAHLQRRARVFSPDLPPHRWMGP